MIPSAGDELAVKWEGLVIAVVSFLVTRALLVSVLYRSMSDGPLGTVAGIIPMLLGLGITVYGVDLAVSTQPRSYVRTVATWYLIGTVGMLLMVQIPMLGGTESMVSAFANDTLAAAVVGGGLGGVVVGIRTATNNRQRRQLERQTDQAVLVNRLLRHEVLNAMTAIRGHSGLLNEGRGTGQSWAVVEENSDRITQTIEDVGHIVRIAGDQETALGPVDVSVAVAEALDRRPDVVVDGAASVPSVQVRADSHLASAITELIDLAAERGDSHPALEVETTDTDAHLSVSADGGWLSENEQYALTVSVPEYDSPDVGYGLSIINLLVSQYDGEVRASVSDEETRVTLCLPRTTPDAPPRERNGVDYQGISQATGAGLAAGLAMGVVLQQFAGGVGIIGGLYGVQEPFVGWITHLFHSVVFSTIFAAAIAHPRLASYARTAMGTIGLGVAFSIGLWLVAAGIIMGVWLNAVGIPSSIPNLGSVSLVGHLVWGLVVAVSLWVAPGGKGD